MGLQVMLGPNVAKVMRVFAGDVVPAKKPDPAIYTLAAQELGVDPARCARPAPSSHLLLREAGCRVILRPQHSLCANCEKGCLAEPICVFSLGSLLLRARGCTAHGLDGGVLTAGGC